MFQLKSFTFSSYVIGAPHSKITLNINGTDGHDFPMGDVWMCQVKNQECLSVLNGKIPYLYFGMLIIWRL